MEIGNLTLYRGCGGLFNIVLGPSTQAHVLQFGMLLLNLAFYISAICVSQSAWMTVTIGLLTLVTSLSYSYLCLCDPGIPPLILSKAIEL